MKYVDNYTIQDVTEAMKICKGNKKMRIPNCFLTEYVDTPNEFKAVCIAYSLINFSAGVNQYGGYELIIKQDTFAKLCGVSIATIKRIICRLAGKGFIINIGRTVKSDGNSGTNVYTIKKYNLQRNYFDIQKRSLKILGGKHLVVYAVACKLAHCNKFFKSYSALSELTGYRRSEIIKIVSLLVGDGLIGKYCRVTKAGDNTANIYIMLHPTFIAYAFQKKKKGKEGKEKEPSLSTTRLRLNSNNMTTQHIRKMHKCSVVCIVSHLKHICQEVLKKFFPNKLQP